MSPIVMKMKKFIIIYYRQLSMFASFPEVVSFGLAPHLEEKITLSFLLSLGHWFSTGVPRNPWVPQKAGGVPQISQFDWYLLVNCR